ncbi:MAG: UDP-N-acetylglucosamine 2-epimerase (non-hydrolyzing) [Planctomycetota bacterium]|nr:UDP-N-acetylglucosamine 2-epimerase (non-hydrolyzing) [Planctomycetota bacterium]
MSICIDIIAGARPNFMKIAPIIHAIQKRTNHGGQLRFRLIHTGQHYDQKMSGDFFSQLKIPEPDINLGVGSGTQAEQTAGIMIGYEKAIQQSRSRMCLVVGDVTSTMACAVTARKMGLPVSHVEAGIRSGDWTMPEEINRVVTDSVTNEFFTTSKFANENLMRFGVSQENIHFVGNTMIDTLLANMNALRPPACWKENSLETGKYLVLTLHRPSNVDVAERLSLLLNEIGKHAVGYTVIFPVHPRTSKVIENIRPLPTSLILIDPQPYLEFNYLVKNSKAVLTDSGGITEETTVMGIPCMTLRDSTERPETVDVGTNEMLGTDPKAIGPALAKCFSNQWKKGSIPEMWDGKAGERIVDVLEKLLS